MRDSIGRDEGDKLTSIIEFDAAVGSKFVAIRGGSVGEGFATWERDFARRGNVTGAGNGD
ncbi:hypothetical protein FHT40_006181 [Mycolicibacterium sp. BK556]|uniref:hypothetical protein n=1 Tax=Mycobacteriaceae TaxID=1762 RepID=UPI000D3FD3E6|nr:MULTISPECIES: hypothetical protein [Mycobacteriaceae]MBB3606490.1 hypothetical protein [Mycolicibacterium sp. BK556]MBB3636264.1 hypothetical protein [Mycolicibacterium sp. BK607]MBB3753556.1 hypothetical protein [Mycolicibacterium sp. BK634]TDO06407.1 hypothetical protein EV580_6493 [Mycobacterium sp. BK086]